MTLTAYAVTVTDATLTDTEPGDRGVPEPSAAHGPPAPHLDDREAYCSDAGMWAPVRDLFCQFCGAADHDLR